METLVANFWHIFQIILMIGGIFCTLLGILTVFHWAKTPKEPNDQSNRINNVASWWFGLTRPDILGKSYKFFRQDVMDNVKDVEDHSK